jgi:hypothetical protein
MKLLEHPDFRGVEPLFATAFIYSTSKLVGRRVSRIILPSRFSSFVIIALQVSEMVHFDFNSEEDLIAALHPHVSVIDPLSKCTNMLFNLSAPSPFYYLVVIVERLYGSDSSSVYSSPGKIHRNQKLRADLVEVCSCRPKITFCMGF